MSPAWWEGRRDLEVDTPGGRALRLLRRFLSEEQRQGFDQDGAFYVKGSGGKNLYWLRYAQVAARLDPAVKLPAIRVTHTLCVHTMAGESLTMEEHYRLAGVNIAGIGYSRAYLATILPPFSTQVPRCDELLADKLLLENDEVRFVRIAIIGGANGGIYIPYGQHTLPYPI